MKFLHGYPLGGVMAGLHFEAALLWASGMLRGWSRLEFETSISHMAWKVPEGNKGLP